MGAIVARQAGRFSTGSIFVLFTLALGPSCSDDANSAPDDMGHTSVDAFVEAAQESDESPIFSFDIFSVDLMSPPGPCQPDCWGKKCKVPDGCGGTCVCWVGQEYLAQICVGEFQCVDAAWCLIECDDPVCKDTCLLRTPVDRRKSLMDLLACVYHNCTGPWMNDLCFGNAAAGPCKELFQECGACTPECKGKKCGHDGCGGFCGICQSDQACNLVTGQCGSPGDGCIPSEFPGCDGCACKDCVCQKEPICCSVHWDEICVANCVACGGCL